jgi:hypothetical protein
MRCANTRVNRRPSALTIAESEFGRDAGAEEIQKGACWGNVLAQEPE